MDEWLWLGTDVCNCGRTINSTAAPLPSSQAACTFGDACSVCQDPLPFAPCSQSDMTSGKATQDATWQVHHSDFVLIGILKSGRSLPFSASHFTALLRLSFRRWKDENAVPCAPDSGQTVARQCLDSARALCTQTIGLEWVMLRCVACGAVV